MPEKEKEDKVLEEIKRHNKVLMEHMEQQVKTVAEQHSSIKEEVNQLGNSVERQFEKVDLRFDSLESTIGNVIRDQYERIKKVEEKVST